MIAIVRFLFDVVLALVAPRAVLVTENVLLRQQLIVARRGVKRPRFRRLDRWLIGALAGRFHRLREAVLLIKPETDDPGGERSCRAASADTSCSIHPAK